VCVREGIFPCSAVVKEVRSMCIAQLQVSVWGGVKGLAGIGVTPKRGGTLSGRVPPAEYQSQSLLCMLVTCGGVGRFRPSK
jgi:hypothetical protein